MPAPAGRATRLGRRGDAARHAVRPRRRLPRADAGADRRTSPAAPTPRRCSPCPAARRPRRRCTGSTARGVPSVVAGSLDEALAHDVAVILGPVADIDVPRLQSFATAGGVLVLEQPFSALARWPWPASRSRPRPRATRSWCCRAAASRPPTVRFPAAETTAWGADAGALARYPDGGAAIAARQVGTGAVVALGVALRDAVLASESSDRRRRRRPGRRRAGRRRGPRPRRLRPPRPHDLRPRGAGHHARRRSRRPCRGARPDARRRHARRPSSAAGALAALERDRGVRAHLLRHRPGPRGSAGAPAGPRWRAAPSSCSALQDAGADVAVRRRGVRRRPRPARRRRRARPSPATRPTTGAGGASLFGEARVSRHVLAAVCPASSRVAFRAPAAVAPPALDGVLAGTGYAVDASLRADVVGGGLPYRLARATTPSVEHPVLRLPLRFDDRTRADARPPRRRARRDPGQPARTTGAPAVVRISPCASARPRPSRWRACWPARPEDVWVGPVDEFARFWAARSSLTLESEPSPAAAARVSPAPASCPAQTLVLPFARRARRARRRYRAAGALRRRPARGGAGVHRRTEVEIRIGRRAARPTRGDRAETAVTAGRAASARRAATAPGARVDQSISFETPCEMSAAIAVKIVFSWPASGRLK